MKISKMLMMGILCLSFVTVTLADGEVPIGNRSGDNPPPVETTSSQSTIVTVIQNLLTLVVGK